MSLLMYADDMVLLADTQEGLQRSITLAYEYSRRWRFLFNVGKDKTEIMIFHGKGKNRELKRRQGNRDCTHKYVYLGVTVDEAGTFREWKVPTFGLKPGFWA